VDKPAEASASSVGAARRRQEVGDKPVEGRGLLDGKTGTTGDTVTRDGWW